MNTPKLGVFSDVERDALLRSHDRFEFLLSVCALAVAIGVGWEMWIEWGEHRRLKWPKRLLAVLPPALVAFGVFGEWLFAHLSSGKQAAVRHIDERRFQETFAELNRVRSPRVTYFDLPKFEKMMKSSPRLEAMTYYQPDNKEAKWLADSIVGGLGGVGWKPLIPYPIPQDRVSPTWRNLPRGMIASMTLAERFSGANGSIVLVTNKATLSRIATLEDALGASMGFVFSYGRNTDDSLPDDTVQIIIDQRD